MIYLMKVIIGLGNPGERYIGNRHNAGFLALDALASKLGVESWESKFGSLVGKTPGVILVKPQTFMNQSGRAVNEIVNFYKTSLDDLVVVHDDLDIKLGEYKIVNGVGPKIHNGINSIEDSLGNGSFWRVRLGIDSRPSGEVRTPGEDYVLSDFTFEEKNDLLEVIDAAVKEIIIKLG